VVASSLGEYVTNRKTNSTGKLDEEACHWAMLSALISLRERAQEMGGDAVINIVSYAPKRAQDRAVQLHCQGSFKPKRKCRDVCPSD
jgi:uncharacterized protein YbjQ (UPF0145 family)